MTKKTYEPQNSATPTVVADNDQVSFTLSPGVDRGPFDRTQQLVDSVDLLGRVRPEVPPENK